MGKIHQMDDLLSNKIAAGEVVERPASVVKELVENAVDAGSTRIEIEVEEAGLAKIRVIDNGDGIEKEDCLLAFARHATSKIKDENDLFRIRSLGFRGEALPSIASVSELEMKTSTGDGPGTLIALKGGNLIKNESTNSRKGTEMVVSNLFFNTPARLKYMKTIHTELGNISDIVNRMAIANPNVSFRLMHNGKKLLHTSGNGDVLQVVAAIYGMSIAKNMIPIKLESLDFKVTGYIAKPEVTRASRNYISTIINGRFIKNYPLVKAIQQGYHTLLPIGRFPIVVLNIEMDPLLVDVNVHPAKLEVRLSKEHELQLLVEEGIRNVFKKQQLIPEAVPPKKKEREETEQQKISFDFSDRVKEISPSPIEKLYNESNHTQLDDPQVDTYVEPVFHEEIVDTNPINLEVEQENTTETVIKVQEEHTVETSEEDVMDRIPPMYPIGQMHGTYIVAQNDQGMFLIDQHAAQERVKYEYFREKVGEITNELQELLVPFTFEYAQSECLTINEYMEELKRVGIFLESFGPQSYIVRAHPTWFPSGNEQELIEEIIQQLLDQRKVDIKKLREEAAIMMSCKGSIKANHHLRNDEIFALLESLRKSSDPFTCPHGRPIIIHFSTYEIEKMFKRVM